ncbi:MAG TPA: Gfo/Idh/MocA family oxidoreductase [Acidimicrobiales bacterium]|nr:Gfo/Idh/MocA family oxidoreductase [Acidimicrobiales bacterium]
MPRADKTKPRRGKAHLAVAGLGRMGAVHARNLALRCPSAQLVGVYDPRSGSAARIAAELGAVAVPSYDDLVADPALDGVVIAAPTGAHADLALSAFRAGKHVFCEKPLSLDRDLTVELVAASEAVGLKLQVGFHRRFDPSYAAAAARVKAGELGDVHLFRGSQRDMAPPRPEFLTGSGGIFVDMGIHDFDAARWLVGEVASVSAYGAALSGPGFAETGDLGTVVVVLTFSNGALGVLDISRVAGYGYESSTELMGSRATVRIDEPFQYGYEWRTAGAASRPLTQTFPGRYAAAFASELDHFARAITEGTPPLVTGADALAAFDLALAADESCRQGRPVSMPPAAGHFNGATAVAPARGQG